MEQSTRRSSFIESQSKAMNLQYGNIPFGQRFRFVEKPGNVREVEALDSSSEALDSSLNSNEEMQIDFGSFDYQLNIGGEFGAASLYKISRPDDIVHQMYLGVGQPKDMEKKIKTDTMFGLYHKYHKHTGEIPVTLNATLHIVYRSYNGIYMHFPIRTRQIGEKTYYQVVDKKETPSFSSLANLVKYYKTYGYLSNRNGMCIEMCP